MKKYNDIQQRTDEWHQLRKGKITGTTLKALMSSRKDTREGAIYELIAERLMEGVESEEYENAMERGNRLESDAISAFELEYKKETEETGFVENDDNKMMGYSPDRLIANSDEEDVEVKCPLGKAYVEIWLTNLLPDEYYWQLVQAFVVNPKLNLRYFVAYHPNITVHPIHVIEIKREDIEEDIEKARVAQEEALKRVEEELAKVITL